jgi:hypothetical protein
VILLQILLQMLRQANTHTSFDCSCEIDASPLRSEILPSMPSFLLCAERVRYQVGFDFGAADTAEQTPEGSEHAE